MNVGIGWDWGRAIPFLGIHKSKFLCGAVWSLKWRSSLLIIIARRMDSQRAGLRFVFRFQHASGRRTNNLDWTHPTYIFTYLRLTRPLAMPTPSLVKCLTQIHMVCYLCTVCVLEISYMSHKLYCKLPQRKIHLLLYWGKHFLRGNPGGGGGTF